MHITKETHYNSVRRNVPKNFGTMMGYCIDQIGTWRPANSYIESWTQFRLSLCVFFLSIPLGYSFILSMPLGYTNSNWVGSMTRWYFCSQVQKKKVYVTGCVKITYHFWPKKIKLLTIDKGSLSKAFLLPFSLVHSTASAAWGL